MTSPLIHLVDDDDAVRHSLALLIGTVGLSVAQWSHPQAFLDGFDRDAIGAIVLDVRMPGTSGLTVLDQLLAQGVDQPVIMLTGHGTVEMCRRAFRAGAAEFLEKPIDDERLLEALHECVRQHVRTRERLVADREARETLTRACPDANEVLGRVIEGRPPRGPPRELAPRRTAWNPPCQPSAPNCRPTRSRNYLEVAGAGHEVDRAPTQCRRTQAIGPAGPGFPTVASRSRCDRAHQETSDENLPKLLAATVEGSLVTLAFADGARSEKAMSLARPTNCRRRRVSLSSQWLCRGRDRGGPCRRCARCERADNAGPHTRPRASARPIPRPRRKTRPRR